MDKEKKQIEFYNTEELRLTQEHRTQRHKVFIEAQLVENKSDNQSWLVGWGMTCATICYIISIIMYFRWW